MQHPGNKIYPSPPVLSDFVIHSSGLHNFSASGDAASPATVATHYVKSTSETYAEYLNAYNAWYLQIQVIETSEHEKALARRALESYREVISFGDALPQSGKDIPIPGYTHGEDDDESLTARVVLEKKTPHEPVVSTKPHRAEKRANKKKLRDSKVKLAAGKLQAKDELIKEVTVSDLKAGMKKVQELKDLRPLHKEELKAAKSAVERAKQIRFGSSDVTTNIVPEEGWKVTTRKKGDYWPQFARVDHPADHTAVRMDPSIGSLGPLALATLRKPTSTVSK
jgi:hypothetical protein